MPDTFVLIYLIQPFITKVAPPLLLRSFVRSSSVHSPPLCLWLFTFMLIIIRAMTTFGYPRVVPCCLLLGSVGVGVHIL